MAAALDVFRARVLRLLALCGCWDCVVGGLCTTVGEGGMCNMVVFCGVMWFITRTALVHLAGKSKQQLLARDRLLFWI